MPMNQGIEYTYDELNRLTAVAYGSGSKIVYTYDPAGNPTSVTIGPTPVAPSEHPCSKCGRMVPVGKKFCTYCGHQVGVPVAPTPMISIERRCPICNRPVPAGKKFCTYDGTPVP
jgi:YD repeat-containing protein